MKNLEIYTNKSMEMLYKDMKKLLTATTLQLTCKVDSDRELQLTRKVCLAVFRMYLAFVPSSFPHVNGVIGTLL